HDAGNLVELAHDLLQLFGVGDIDGDIENGKAISGGVNIEAGDIDLAGTENRGNIHQQVGPVLTDHFQRGGIGLLDVVAPGDLDPAALFAGIAAAGIGVGAVLAVDADAVAPGNEAHDLIPRHRGAALGELHQAVGKSFHHDALLALDPLGHSRLGFAGLLARLGGGRSLCRRFFHSSGLDHVDQFIPDPVDRLQGGIAAVANGGIHLVQTLEAHPLENGGQHIRRGDLAHGQPRVLELRLKGGSALGNVLLLALFLEPLADLAAGLAALGDFHPVPAGAVGGLGGVDLHDVAVVEHTVKAYHPAVDLGPHHGIADGGVDGIGKVNGSSAGGEVDDVSPGGEH